jgi:rare lipoprotein A
MKTLLLVLLPALLLAACGGDRPLRRDTGAATTTAATKGGYYKDDGPGSQIPERLEQLPDPEPKAEPLNRGTARPYVVFGKSYTPHTSLRPFRQRGVASWYGKKFHGQKTASGETYDMFAMTAAHTVLPIPSYVRVTNPANGKSVIVRVNDRGPFHSDRVIDLSYAAALKLDYIGRGSTVVEIEQIIPGETAIAAPAVPPAKPVGLPPAAPDPIAAVAARTTELPVGVYLQLGAFGNADNADNFRGHLERELDWLEEKIRVVSAELPNGSPIHRVQAGPYANRAEAEKMAERVSETLGSLPTLIQR